ncbi:MAG TPA: hypothetical protein PKD95_03325 [Candidatus Paceibacterota bacterium]|nr:hypothetical protein [Candidatus Paceibacterota bacterium]
MPGLGYILLLNLGLFVIFAWIFTLEQTRQQRLFLPNIRARLDQVTEKTIDFLSRKINYVGRHIIKLSWYYGLHRLLRMILVSLVKTYDLLEAVFTENRDRARRLKIEKKNIDQSSSHLGQVAEHKTATALSDKQKKKLLQKKLERG